MIRNGYNGDHRSLEWWSIVVNMVVNIRVVHGIIQSIKLNEIIVIGHSNRTKLFQFIRNQTEPK